MGEMKAVWDMKVINQADGEKDNWSALVEA